MKVIIGAAILAAATALPWDDVQTVSMYDTDVSTGPDDSANCGDNESYDWTNDAYPSSWGSNNDGDNIGGGSVAEGCKSFCSYFTKSNFQAIADGNSSIGNAACTQTDGNPTGGNDLDDCDDGDDVQVASKTWFCSSCFGGDDIQTTAKFCSSCFGGDDAAVKARFCSSCFGGDDAETTARFCSSCFGGDDAKVHARFCSSCFGGDDAATTAKFCSSCFGGDDAKVKARFCSSCFGGDDAKVKAAFCSSCFGGDDAETTAKFCSSCFGGDDAAVKARFCSSCFGGDDAMTTAGFCSSCFGGDDAAVKARFCSSCFGGDIQNPKPLYGDVKTHARFCSSCFGGDIQAAALCTGCPGSDGIDASYWTNSREGGAYKDVIAKTYAHSAEVACNSSYWMSASSGCQRGWKRGTVTYTDKKGRKRTRKRWAYAKSCPTGKNTCTEATHNYMKSNFPKEYHLWQLFYCCISNWGEKSSASRALAAQVNTKLRAETSGSASDVIKETMDLVQAGTEGKTIEEVHSDGNALGDAKSSYDIMARVSVSSVSVGGGGMPMRD